MNLHHLFIFFVQSLLVNCLVFNELCNEETSHLHKASCIFKRRVLVVLPNPLMPTQMGSDKRAYHVLQSVLAFGYDVHVVVLSTSSSIPNANDEMLVRQLNIKYQPSPLSLRNISATYSDLLQSIKPEIVIMWLWFWTFGATAPGLLLGATRALSPQSYIMLFTDDVHSKRELQLAQAQQTSEQHQRVQARALKMKRLELWMYEDSDVVVTISEADRRDLLTMDDAMTLSLQDKVFVMRYVLAPDEISSGVAAVGSPFSARSGLVFVGNGANPTNAIALRWYMAEVAPLLQTALPGVALTCVGGLWEPFKAAWPQSSDAIRFTGYQSEGTMRESLDRSKVFISPIVAATGINTKNVLALARGIPLVTMPAGSKGLCKTCDAILLRNPYDVFASEPASNTEASLIDMPMLVGRTAADFAEKVVSVYTSESLWERYAGAGPKHARSWFSEGAGASDLEAILLTLFARPPQKGSGRSYDTSDSLGRRGRLKRGRQQRGSRKRKQESWE